MEDGRKKEGILGENVVDFVDFWQPFVLTKASKSIIQSRRHEVVE